MESTLQAALNEQLKHEMNSAYLYLSMAAYYGANNLDGFAHWMQAQAHEELEHAMKFYAYIESRGNRVALQALDQPKAEFASPTAAFEEALAHEKWITSKIHELYALAQKENDHATEVFLQWFITEQVEEEANVGKVVDLLHKMGEQPHSLMMIDRQLAHRGAH